MPETGMPGAKVMTLSEFDIRYYRTEALMRQKRDLEELHERYMQAWNLARQAAKLLKEKFGASKVAVFGSILREKTFTPWSDVDIAAWGISPSDTLRAIGEVMDLSNEIEVSLVPIDTCKPVLRAIIEKEGLEI